MRGRRVNRLSRYAFGYSRSGRVVEYARQCMYRDDHLTHPPSRYDPKRLLDVRNRIEVRSPSARRRHAYRCGRFEIHLLCILMTNFILSMWKIPRFVPYNHDIGKSRMRRFAIPISGEVNSDFNIALHTFPLQKFVSIYKTMKLTNFRKIFLKNPFSSIFFLLIASILCTRSKI